MNHPAVVFLVALAALLIILALVGVHIHVG